MCNVSFHHLQVEDMDKIIAKMLNMFQVGVKELLDMIGLE